MNWVEGIIQYLTGLGYAFAVGALSGYEIWTTRLWKVRGQIVTSGHRLMLWGLLAMAASCGPHHLDLGAHMMFYGHPTTPIDMTAIVLAFPWAVSWTWFRLGQVFPWEPTPTDLPGRYDLELATKRPWWHPPGDHLVSGEKTWPSVLLGGMLGYMVAVMITTFVLVQQAGVHDHLITWGPQILLLVLYCAIGYLLWSAQYERRARVGSWSLASLSLAVIFPTCAISHWTYATAVARGVYPVQDWHTTVADLYGVLAAVFFLFVAINQRRIGREAS